ncbi:hypothetical protein llg_42820 [Luteolibacter sp. LG18]|nr:hypothetical protein llg_42820 [Luteolibacter sp. LG18]
MAGLAAAIWLRDRQWMLAPADTLPLMLGLPLMAFLGQPWCISEVPRPVAAWRWLVGGGLLGFGWTTAMLTSMAAGWAVLAGCWMERGFVPTHGKQRLVWIGLLSFPWLVIDWPGIGWAYRLSGAAFVEQVFSVLAMPVSRDGVTLEVVGMPVEVQAACAGWNLLQLCLLTGLASGAVDLRRTSRFGILLGALPLVAWLANSVRIFLLAVAGLSWGAGVASGPLHTPIALLVLLLVLVSTRGFAAVLEPKTVVRRYVT